MNKKVYPAHLPKGAYSVDVINVFGVYKNMKWDNLKENKCPKCSKTFAPSAFNVRPGYVVCVCGFQINERKLSEIVSQKVNAKLDEERLENEEDKY